MKLKFTITSIEQIQQQEHDLVVWDSVLPDFGCKFTPAGRRSYFVYYRTNNGQQRRPR
jgi:hypothetical protein